MKPYRRCRLALVWMLVVCAGWLLGSSAFAARSATPTACDGNLFCSGFEETAVMPGTTPVALGDPSLVAFNGLALIPDTLHHVPRHAVPADWGTAPGPLASDSRPSIPQISVLNRRDAAIIYVPKVRGAADYRANIFDPGSVTFSGTQPRGAVIACAGYCPATPSLTH